MISSWRRGFVALFVGCLMMLSLAVVSADGFVSILEPWQDFFCLADEVCAVGDFDGDGRDDIATFVRSTTSGGQVGDVYVALSTGSAFGASAQWQELFCIDDETCAIGDVDGDGRDDIVAFVRNTTSGGQVGDVYVALSTGSAFGASAQWKEQFCLESSICEVADMNGDGRGDLVAFVRSADAATGFGDVRVALSTGTGFADAALWHDFFCIPGEECRLGDVNGDGNVDAVAFIRSTKGGTAQGNVLVALSDGTRLLDATLWHAGFCVREEMCMLGDVNGDGSADAVSFVRDARTGDRQGDIYVSLSAGTTFTPLAERWHPFFCLDGEQCVLGDFDGDEREDAGVFIRDTQTDDTRGDVYVALSNAEVDSPTFDPGPALPYRVYIPYLAR